MIYTRKIKYKDTNEEQICLLSHLRADKGLNEIIEASQEGAKK